MQDSVGHPDTCDGVSAMLVAPHDCGEKPLDSNYTRSNPPIIYAAAAAGFTPALSVPSLPNPGVVPLGKFTFGEGQPSPAEADVIASTCPGISVRRG